MAFAIASLGDGDDTDVRQIHGDGSRAFSFPSFLPSQVYLSIYGAFRLGYCY